MYLSDVELGGTTAFIDVGINVTPEKGGAVFWYNLDRNGSGIEETFHAACPVLVGVKWVANKWIKYNGQHHVYKCPIRLEEWESNQMQVAWQLGEGVIAFVIVKSGCQVFQTVSD